MDDISTREEQEAAQLVAAAQQGDREAMAAIFEQTRAAVLRTVRVSVHDEALAEDVLQETYLRAFANIQSLREPEKLLPWLRAIAKNQAKNALLAKKPLLFSELERVPEGLDAEDAPGPELALEEKEEAERVRQALEQLSPGQRRVMELYYLEQNSVREIAELLGISRGTVKSQLYFGRRRVEKQLRQTRWKDSVLPGLAILRLRGGKAAKTVMGAAAESGRSALVTRLIAGAMSLSILGGAAWAATQMLDAQKRFGDVRPPETVWVEQRTDPTQPPTEPPTEAPTEAPTEKQTQAPTEATTEAPTEPPAEPPPEQTEPSEPANPSEDAGQIGPTEPFLPTDNPYPFTYQELELPVGSTWTGSFATEEQWGVRYDGTECLPDGGMKETYAPVICTWEDGLQTVVLQLDKPGVFFCSLQREGGSSYIRWVKFTVTSTKDAASQE